MKNIRSLFLVIIVFCASSFKQDNLPASFEAAIDGNTFAIREEQMFRGLLIDKKASMDGKIPERKIISTTVHGSTYNITADKTFTETIQFEIGYDSLRQTGTPSYFALALQYKSGSYYMVKDESKLEITGLQWESDKKHFIVSVDYDCKMRSRGFPADGKSDISLKGKLTNFRITVPSWLVPKN